MTVAAQKQSGKARFFVLAALLEPCGPQGRARQPARNGRLDQLLEIRPRDPITDHASFSEPRDISSIRRLAASRSPSRACRASVFNLRSCEVARVDSIPKQLVSN